MTALLQRAGGALGALFASHPHRLGIFLCVLSTASIASQDVMSKKLLEHFSVAQIVFARHVAFFAVVAGWLAWRHGAREVAQVYRRARSVRAQWLRSTLLLVEMAVFCFGMGYVGVAEAHAVFMLFPILTALMARAILGEALTRGKTIALALGFAGALLIFRPTFGGWGGLGGLGGLGFDAPLLIPLVAALLYALYNVVTRQAAQDGVWVSLAYMSGVGLLLCAPFGVWDFLSWDNSAIPFEFWLLLGLIAVTGIVTHVLIVISLQYAPASLLAPFNYTLVGWAMLFGWLYYGEILQLPDIIGISIVLAAGLLVGRR